MSNEHLREDHYWNISGLSSLEMQVREHNIFPIRVGEVCWYRGDVNNYILTLVVVADIPNTDGVFAKRNVEGVRDGPVSPGSGEGWCSDYSTTQDPSSQRILAEEPIYGVYLAEHGDALDADEVDSELAVTHKPGRYFSGVRVDQLIPYLAHTIPSPLPPSVKATENLFVGSKAAHFITPFAVLPWDYKNGPQVISPRPLGKGTMSKFACAFLGAEKINQYDVVRVSGPGRKNLDFERIENGYWKYLPLSLDEALMRVSCWIAYMDEDGNTTHVNARGQLFSPFPLKAHIKVKEVTRKEEIPIPNASVQKWPHIQDIEDNDEFEMTWFQYFPSVSGDVEIPAFVEDALVISSTATTWEKVGPIETPVMALTSSNVASQYHDFEKLRSASCEAMRIEIAARWKANVDYSKFEETVLRSVDILGRFYQPNELYYWSAIHMPFTKCLQLPIELPLRLHSCSVTKFAPQRAQAFNWAGLGHIQGTSALEKDYIPNLSTKRLKDFQKAVAESVGLKAKQGVAPWEEIQAYKIDRPSNELISYHYTQAPFRYSDALDLGTVVPERLVRLIGPVNGSYEKVYGSKHVFGEDLWLDWEKQDHDENEHDLKEWQRYAAAVKEFIEEAVDEDSWYSQSETDDDADDTEVLEMQYDFQSQVLKEDPNAVENAVQDGNVPKWPAYLYDEDEYFE